MNPSCGHWGIGAGAFARVAGADWLAGSSEVELLKGELAVVEAEHSIVLPRLQERRADSIDAIYAKMAAAERALREFVNPIQQIGNHMAKAEAARTALTAAQDVFDEKRIWQRKVRNC